MLFAPGTIIWEDMEALYKRNINWNRLYGKSVFITGAYGMLASYAVYMLIFLNETVENSKIDIYACGRDEQKAKSRFGNYMDKPYFHFIKSSLDNPNIIEQHYDFIIHAASKASSQYYATDPIGVITPNVFGTYYILNNLKHYRCESMLYISSGEVYGAVDEEKVDEHMFGSSDCLDIRNCYGESKRMGECLCKCFSEQYKIPVKIVRLGHTYGPTMDIYHDKRVFSEFVGNVVNGQNIAIKSSGHAMRAFCYAADAVAAFYMVLLSGENGEAYNISNYSGLISIKDLAKCLTELYPEKKLKVEYTSREVGEAYIESRQEKHAVPSTKRLEGLGWSADYSVQVGFKRTIESFLRSEK